MQNYFYWQVLATRCEHKECFSCKRHHYPLWGKPHCCECHGCFPSASSVSLENGESVAMSQLQIGDKIQTGMAILNALLKAPSNVILNRGYSKTVGLSFDCKALAVLAVT